MSRRAGGTQEIADGDVPVFWACGVTPQAAAGWRSTAGTRRPTRSATRSTYDGDWRGWWGQEPPYHAPVFVLTHHAHDPIEMGGTTSCFVTDGFDAALAMAREAGDGDVDIAGGASVVRQALAAGELDELTSDIAPVLLGSGERIFDETTMVNVEPVEVEHTAWATHLRYRITR